MQKYSKGKPEQLIFTDRNWKQKPRESTDCSRATTDVYLWYSLVHLIS